jgi:ribA/ribD-fused uncharacterized protein
VIAYLHFFGPENPDGFLDAHHRAQIVYRGITFGSASHLLVYVEARFFGDVAAEGCIRLATSPKAVQAAARSLRRDPALERAWTTRRWRELLYVQRLKFEQHPELRRLLIGTGDALLCYADPAERIMGIGVADNHPNACAPARWVGQNLLGRALTSVRAQLAGCEAEPHRRRPAIAS